MSKLLTDAELELMAVIWRRGPSTTRELLSALDDGRAYTTVSTLLRILVDKGFLEAQPEGRSHRYAPLIAQADYQGRGLSHVVAGLFGGDALGLVRRLVRSEQLDEAQLADLRALVDRELGGAEVPAGRSSEVPAGRSSEVPAGRSSEVPAGRSSEVPAGRSSETSAQASAQTSAGPLNLEGER